MPIELKCSKAGCTTVMAVKEEHAGKSVKCPTCGTVTVVPSVPAAAVAVAPVPAPAPAAAPVSPPLPQATPEAAPTPTVNFLETVQALCKANNLDDVSRNLLGGGMGALALLVLSMLLPRYYASFSFLGVSNSAREFWIGTAAGAMIFLLSIAVAGFVLASFAKMHVFLRNSIFAAAGWGALSFLLIFFIWLVQGPNAEQKKQLGDAIQYGAGFGTYLGLLASMGIMGTFGFLSYQEWLKMKK